MIDPIIKRSLDKAMSYDDYTVLMNTLVENDATTGTEQTEALVAYTKLNARRMKRWDKTLKITSEAQQSITGISKKLTWLVITESWCGDAAHVVPVLNKLSELNDNIDFKIVLRDENLELMDMFLTNGGRAIAKLIIIDNETGQVLNTFGPRPSKATALVNNYKAEHGVLTPEFKEDLQLWYNKDKGQNIIEDIALILQELQLEMCV
ncbi:Thiol-disulfide isomerase or thioredoxin [Hyunsoonleella jejuensis]|uniref:Thiol-disulfide isomerase or thioredoxin n=1 Tax=Hyunsoonleella jejuensis TaxID=419940 RepID=A0A1H9BWG5_9FLAO|nr:thioredoxin family protein [Hyunsoonleella jejuensis]SEP93280.1 Thiol-disulfide isomerase or thioredoxin [Hyunsoonleella jejuensis]